MLHQHVPPDAPPDERDTLHAAAAVLDALAAQGWDTERLALTLDLGAAASRLLAEPPDLVFNLVDSLPGVPGTGPLASAAAALLQGLGLPHTGSPLPALALAGDKPATRRTLRAAGLPVPPGPGQGWTGRWIVKHATEHASHGLGPHSVVDRPPEAPPPGWFAEAFLEGREFNVSLLDGTVLPVAELEYAAAWPRDRPRLLDYAGKWDTRDPVHALTRRRFGTAEPALHAELERLARACWDVLGLRGYARVDLRLDRDGRAHVLEANANPCLTPDAGFAAAAAEAGLDYPALIRRIAGAALPAPPPSPHERPVDASESPAAGRPTCSGGAFVRPGDGGACTAGHAGDEAGPSPPGSDLPGPGEAPGETGRDETGRDERARRTGGASAGGRPPGRPPAWREEPRPGDDARIGALCRATGFFGDEEVAVAEELAADRLARGAASDYRFLFADGPDGALLGYACYGRTPCTRAAWDLYWIAVCPASQGGGLGRALADAVAARVARAGGGRLYAETSGRPLYEPTRRFYAAAGFTRQAVVPEFYGPGDDKQVWMRPVGD